MNWLDVLIAFIVSLPTFFGFRKGFVRKLFGIAGLIGGFILAVKFYPSVSSLLVTFIKNSDSLVNVLSFLMIITLIYGLSLWIARFMSDINAGTRLIDKILGSIFGFIQGIMISSIILYNLAIIDIPSSTVRDSSLFYPRIIGVAPLIFDKVLHFFPGLKELYKEYNILGDDKEKKEKQ